MTRYLVIIPIISIFAIIGTSVFSLQSNGQTFKNIVSVTDTNDINDIMESITVRCPLDSETGLRECPKTNCTFDPSDLRCTEPFPIENCERTLKGCSCNNPYGLSCPQPGRGPTASITDSDISNNNLMSESTFDTRIVDNSSERKNPICMQDADGNSIYDENGNKICM
jgi:hypothetical protein